MTFTLLLLLQKERADRQRAEAERAERDRVSTDKREARNRGAEGKRNVKIVWADVGGAGARGLRASGSKREVAAIVVPSGADAEGAAVAAAAAAAAGGSGAGAAGSLTAAAAPTNPAAAPAAAAAAVRPGSSSGSRRAGNADVKAAAAGDSRKQEQRSLQQQQQQQVTGSYLQAACRKGDEGHPPVSAAAAAGRSGTTGVSSNSSSLGNVAGPATDDEMQSKGLAGTEGVGVMPLVPVNAPALGPLVELSVSDQQLLMPINAHESPAAFCLVESSGLAAMSGPVVSAPPTPSSADAVCPASGAIISASITRQEQQQQQREGGMFGGDLLLGAAYPLSSLSAAAGGRQPVDLGCHVRTSSFDILGDVHAKLDREVLEMLGVAEGPSPAAATATGGAAEAEGMQLRGVSSTNNIRPSSGGSSSSRGSSQPQQQLVSSQTGSGAGGTRGGMAGGAPSSWRLSDGLVGVSASAAVGGEVRSDSSNKREGPGSSGMHESGGNAQLGVGVGAGGGGNCGGGDIWNSALGLGGAFGSLGATTAAAAAAGAVARRASSSSGTGAGTGSAMEEVAGATAQLQTTAASTAGAGAAGGVERRYSCDGVTGMGAGRYQGRLAGFRDEGVGLGLGGGRWGPLSPGSPSGALLASGLGGFGIGAGSALAAGSLGGQQQQHEQQQQQLRLSLQGEGLRGTSGVAATVAAPAGGGSHSRPPLMPRLSMQSGGDDISSQGDYMSPAGALRGAVRSQGLLSGGAYMSPTSPGDVPGLLMGYTNAAGDLALLTDHHRHQLMMSSSGGGGRGGGGSHHAVMRNASGNLGMGPLSSGYGQVSSHQQQQQVLGHSGGWSLGLQGRGPDSLAAGMPLSPATASAAMVLGGPGPLAAAGGAGGYMLPQQQQQAGGMLPSPAAAGAGQQLCQAYLSGFCAHGDQCMFLHVPPPFQHHQQSQPQHHLLQQYNGSCYGTADGAGGGPRGTNQDRSGPLLGPLGGSFRGSDLDLGGGLHDANGGFAGGTEPSPSAAAAAAAAVSAATVTGMGAYSSFAFGAPGSSAFSSHGFVGEAGVLRGRAGSGSGSGGGSGVTGKEKGAAVGVSASAGGAGGLPNLPEDLSFSPPSKPPAGQLLPSHLF